MDSAFVLLTMASNRRRFEEDLGGAEGLTAAKLQEDELRLEAQDAVEAEEAPVLGVPLDDPGPEVVTVEPQLPICWIWPRPGAVLMKATGEERQMDEVVGGAPLLACYGWVPLEAGTVAVGLGDQGKWFISLDQWAVYRREA
jgi:hypothetical protein